jgi:peptidyl-prolyl cis-trans isomerase SurA
MMLRRHRVTTAAAVMTALAAPLPVAMPGLFPGLVTTAHASEVLYSINGEALTSYDVQRRAAFLKLQGKGGGTAAATEEMINQTLVMQEAEKLGIRVAQGDIDAAFKRFAEGNRMSVKQITTILNQSGVTAKHFKEFIRAQMTGGQVIQVQQRRSGGGLGLTQQEIAKKIREMGSAKPKATEYVLQQVIFVVPGGQKGKVAARKREADAFRTQFRNCESTRAQAKGLIDVSVKDLGRLLAAELPGEWRDSISTLSAGGTTPSRATERGVEFIAVCRTREVSDDRVAELQFQADAVKGVDGTEAGKAMVDELRKNALIVKR